MRIIVIALIGGGNANAGKKPADLDAGFLAAQTQVQAQGFGRLVANPENRIERSHGLLKNHSHASAPDGAHFRFRKIEKINPVKHGAAANQGLFGHKAQNGPAGQALAAARFPHYAGNGGPFQAEADIPHSGLQAAIVGKADRKVFQAQEWRHNPRNPLALHLRLAERGVGFPHGYVGIDRNRLEILVGRQD